MHTFNFTRHNQRAYLCFGDGRVSHNQLSGTRGELLGKVPRNGFVREYPLKHADLAGMIEAFADGRIACRSASAGMTGPQACSVQRVPGDNCDLSDQPTRGPIKLKKPTRGSVTVRWHLCGQPSRQLATILEAGLPRAGSAK